MSPKPSSKARRVAWIGAPIAAAALAIAVASPAGAATTGKIDVTSPTIAPGGATAVLATFNVTDDPANSIVSITVAPIAGASGTVSITLVTSDGAAKGCDPTGPTTRIDCFWQQSSGPGGTVSVTATASADAVGSFEVKTMRTSALQGIDAPVAKTTIVVQAPPTTTTAPAVTTTAAVTTTTPGTTVPTTTTPGTTGPATTVGPPTNPGTLPTTGSGTTLALGGVGLAVLAMAGMALLVARRTDSAG